MMNLWDVALGWNDEPERTVKDAFAVARRAADLDPRDPLAHVALGWTYIVAGIRRTDSIRNAEQWISTRACQTRGTGSAGLS